VDPLQLILLALAFVTAAAALPAAIGMLMVRREVPLLLPPTASMRDYDLLKPVTL
jgi:hypothetical protein